MTFGFAMAFAASGTARALLYKVSPLDPATWLAVAATVGSMAMLATLVPGWRAVNVDVREAMTAD